MFLRMLVLAGGVAGAAGLSQFPEYAQQYRQRLAGAVDELSVVTADFDASASAEGLSRAAALESMGGSGFIGRRHDDMARAFARLEQLRADLALLQGAGPFTRLYHASHMTDREIAARALQDFEPAMPVTFEGVSFAGAGFVGGMAVLSLLFAVLRVLVWPFRRRAPTRRRRAGGSGRGNGSYRAEPQMRRSQPVVRRGGAEPPIRRPRRDPQ